MTREISSSDNVIDSRDIIARLKELEDEREALVDAVNKAKEEEDDDTKEISNAETDLEDWDLVNGEELESLRQLNKEGEQATSEWIHGVGLIRESYWVEFCEEKVKDMGYLQPDIPWWIEIDWEKTADNMQQDYGEIEYDGVIFLYRA